MELKDSAVGWEWSDRNLAFVGIAAAVPKMYRKKSTVFMLPRPSGRRLDSEPWQKMEVESPLCTQPGNKSLTNSQYSLNLFPH